MPDELADGMKFKVVVNEEEQYSIWPADRQNAIGWRDAGMDGSKTECLNFVGKVWTDMRPRSLRNRMPAVSGQPQ
jgi:MbtH protein